MTVAELTALLQTVCPIFGVDSNGNISFDPSSTPSQQQQAQQIVAQNIARLNGQPSRITSGAAAIFAYLTKSIANGGGGLTAAQQIAVAMACCAVVLEQNPALGAKINQATGLSIPYDQANPQG